MRTILQSSIFNFQFCLTALLALTFTPLTQAAEPVPAKPIFSVYTGNSTDGITQYEQWLGRPTDAILGYTGDKDWKDYEGSVGWAIGLWSKIDRPVLWSVALMPKDGATLAEAAQGLYNGHYKSIAQKLAKTRPSDPVLYIRTGWEFNGGWFHYKAVKQPEAFIGAWRQFVTTFRSVSDRFRFDWCPSAGDWMPMNAEDAYPGDAYVDVIGLDIYDETKWCKIADPVERWKKVHLNGKHGLVWHRDFARAHRKPMSYPEWGACGNGVGDGGYFIEQMHKWCLENHVLYASYWDSNAGYPGKLSTGQYPKAAESYRALFGKPPASAPAPKTGR